MLDPDSYTGQIVDLKEVEAITYTQCGEAWDAGAWRWDLLQRKVFANDLANLTAVSGPANRQKSDSGSDELPTLQPHACIQRYLDVATKYQLPITVAERNAATAVICHGDGNTATSPAPAPTAAGRRAHGDALRRRGDRR